MGYKGAQPCCETGKSVYDGVVASRLPVKAMGGAVGAA